MKKELQPQLQQQQQEQLLLQHPYMSLYEPVLKPEFNVSPPSSSSKQQQQQQQQQQRPDDTFSFVVAEQLSRINTAVATTTTTTTTSSYSIYRAYNIKRQKIKHNANVIANNTIQSVVHKCNHEEDDDDDVVDGGTADDDASSLDSSDDEVIIEPIESATKKTNKKKRKARSTSTATANNTNNTTTTCIRRIAEESSESSAVSGDNNATRVRTYKCNIFDTRWEEVYQRLVAYKKEHNHTKIPIKCKEHPQLGSWVDTQRTAYKKKKMTEERKRLLDSIGFLWDGKAPRIRCQHPYMSLYEPVLKPQFFVSPPSSSSSSSSQQQQQQQQQQQRPDDIFSFAVADQLPPSSRLTDGTATAAAATYTAAATATATTCIHGIGEESSESSSVSSDNNATTVRSYKCNTFDTRWKEVYQRLVAYKKEHKHTKIPIKYKKDPQLGRWVDTQRTAYKKKKMTEERKRLLDYIGFSWDGKAPVTSTVTLEEVHQRLV